MKPTNRQAALDQLKRSQVRAKRNRNLAFGGVVLAIVVVLAVFVTVGLNRDKTNATTTTADNQVVSLVTSVSTTAFDSVGTGGGAAKPPTAIKAPALTADGKPRVLYVGAEFCPYCAAERWSVVAALSRFGSFSGLGQTASSANDVFPNTPTLSFHGATYTSKYLSFTGIEETDTNQKPLDQISAADDKIVNAYNPTCTAGSGCSIPFIDLGGAAVNVGSSYDPQLFAGKSHLEIAQAINDPSSELGQAVDGSANYFTAVLCQLTGGQPGAVCTSKGVTAAATALGSS